MLTDAATGTPHFFPPRELAKVAVNLGQRPGLIFRRMSELAAELRRVAAGRSEVSAARGDRRFADAAWGNWLFRRLLQSYLAVGSTVDELVSDAGVDWRTERQVRLAASNLIDALAPTNFLVSNPTVIKETVDRGGANLVDGMRNFVRDMSRPPRLPATVDTSKFTIGVNLAATRGSVVLRTAVFELIQYRAQTESVRVVPLLLVPPTINKFYVLDIAPDRSMVEYFVRQGQQVFTISWRNPTKEQREYDFDTYAAAVLEARDAVAEITRHRSVHLCAACSGGLIAAGAVNHVAAQGGASTVASLTCSCARSTTVRRGQSRR